MKLWQRAFVPTEAYYQRDGTSEGFDDTVRTAFGVRVYACYDNRGLSDEVLLATPSGFVHAAAQVQFARGAGLISAERALAELAEMQLAQIQLENVRSQIKKINRRWAAMEEAAIAAPAGDAKEAKRQEKMVEQFKELGALWLLPNFIAWGKHRSVEMDFWREKCPTILRAARIDESNAFMCCANLDYGSFNRRVCAVVALLAERGNIENSAAETILEHARWMGRHGSSVRMGWGMSENGATRPLHGFPDAEGLGPLAIAALEAIALRGSIRHAAGPATHNAAPAALRI